MVNEATGQDAAANWWDEHAAARETAALALLALVVYWITGPPAAGDMWPPLAEAFLSGQLHLSEDRPWLELVPRPAGGQFVPLPPVPALTLIPAALVTGPGTPWGELDGNVYASVVGAINVALAYWLLLGWGVAPDPRRWLTIGFAFTTHWWVAGMAGPHHYAEICAVMFSLGALNLAVRGRAPLVAGLLVGLAAGSRLPAGLALPAVAAIYAHRAAGGWRLGRAQLMVVAGVALPALLTAVYNVARFGSPLDFGYAHIPSGETGLITDEPWFSEGLMSVSYIPRHLQVMFLDGFAVVPEPPFLMPSLSGASLVLTAPFLFLSVLARGRLVPWLWAAVLLVMLPDLMWGSWGFAQFGYRRILDAVPLLLLLLGLAYRDRADWALRGTVLVGMVVHAYGIWVINVLGFVR
ncbi:MAG TPA: hypothetical protein VFP30_00865 [Candidatus Limnocylindria bacterium]|nr:hypothetical protein [Candidatus Limnocylindria bacterium]